MEIDIIKKELLVVCHMYFHFIEFDESHLGTTQAP